MNLYKYRSPLPLLHQNISSTFLPLSLTLASRPRGRVPKMVQKSTASKKMATRMTKERTNVGGLKGPAAAFATAAAFGGQLRKRYMGVRQSPSARWVAEIKATAQKIRLWLGTVDTAEEAARAYDEAACLLPGANTRTNFWSRPGRSGPSQSVLSAKVVNHILGHFESQRAAAGAHPYSSFHHPPPPMQLSRSRRHHCHEPSRSCRRMSNWR